MNENGVGTNGVGVVLWNVKNSLSMKFDMTMNAMKVGFWGRTRYWWVVLVVGILLVIGGFAYWFWPMAGYAVVSQLFGWLLIVVGVVQLCVSAGVNRPRGWGWWIAGGVIDLFVGFMLVRSVILSELLLPFFLALIFVYWGVASVAASVDARGLWWLNIINGILLLIIGFLFMEAGYVQNVMMVSFLTSIAFVYWGFTIAIMSYDLKPCDGSRAERRG